MSPGAGLYLAAALLLGLAGGAKVLQPEDTARALQVAGVRVAGRAVGRSAVRAAAGLEVALAAAALVVPGPLPAAAVALSYLAFTGFVAAALIRHWPLATCGCLGRADTSPTVGHVVVDAVASAAAGWWAVAGPAWLPRSLAHQPGHGVALVVAALALLAVTLVVLADPRGRSATPSGGPGRAG